MTHINHNSQSFAIDGRRTWLLGATVQYVRIPADLWRERLRAVRDAGFNTIETSCPWFVHEPRKGRFHFEDNANVRQFVECCDELGLRVILRAGPSIGSQFDGGGLPAWLMENPKLALRQANEHFLERVTRYFKRLFENLDDLQITRGGPIILVQSEHEWRCSNQHQADRYLLEITRIIRECGITVPLLNANELWQETPGAVDTWCGWDDLLANLRQMHVVRPDAPRLAHVFNASALSAWGHSPSEPTGADTWLWRLAEVLAAGAQPIIQPFHGGTNFGFLGGRLAGKPDRFVGTCPAPEAPLGEAGQRGESYHAVRRILTFAHHFGHVFAELDPDYQPIVVDLIESDEFAGSGGTGKTASRKTRGGFSIVPQRGSQGRVVFVFGFGDKRQTTMLLDDGLRMPVDLGDQPVGWYVFDVDLQGSGRLDYANLCPLAIVDRSILVLQGPAKMDAYFSINGVPGQAVIPGGKKPLVIDHRGITIVLCNQGQIDVTHFDEQGVYVGISGFDEDGQPLPAKGHAKAWHVGSDRRLASLTPTAGDESVPKPASGKVPTIASWEASTTEAYLTGESPRFALLDGPATLPTCGANSGYGWYRVKLKVTQAKKKLYHLSQAADRLHLFVEGEGTHLFGVGPGAENAPFNTSLPKGNVTLVALADNLGRFSEGNDLYDHKGWFGHLYHVKPLRTIKGKTIEGEPVDPMILRPFLDGGVAGQLSELDQMAWSFTHAKKSPLIVEISGAPCRGTFVLNDAPIAYYAGVSGAMRMSLLLQADKVESFKRGKNELRFAPDAQQECDIKDFASSVVIYECLETVTDSAEWAFAKWEQPAASSWSDTTKSQARALRGAPLWWRGTFPSPTSSHPLWLDTAGLSKGQVYLNGNNVGRYFTADAAGKSVGPQTRLYLPPPWLHTEPEDTNELIIFDEHGFDPYRTSLQM